MPAINTRLGPNLSCKIPAKRRVIEKVIIATVKGRDASEFVHPKSITSDF